MSIIDNIKILSCPFCFSEAKIKSHQGYSDYDSDKIFYDVYCTNQNCYLQDGSDWNIEDVNEIVKLWNTRVDLRKLKYNKLLK